MEQFGDRLRECQKLLADAGLPTSALHALRLMTSVFADPGLQGGRPILQTECAVRIVEMLTNTVECELASHKYLELTAENKPFYDEPKRGWEAIIVRFPDAVTDVEDMHKCFALERYSASVFHSLQAVEHGLIELGTYIGVAALVRATTYVTDQGFSTILWSWEALAHYKKPSSTSRILTTAVTS